MMNKGNMSGNCIFASRRKSAKFQQCILRLYALNSTQHSFRKSLRNTQIVRVFFCINIEFQSTQCNGCWVPMLKGREQYLFILLQVQVGKRAIRIVGNSNLPSETGFFQSIFPKFLEYPSDVPLCLWQCFLNCNFSKHFGTSEYFSRF